MPKIMESDVPHSVPFQQFTEIVCDISGIKDISHGIHKHIPVVFRIVTGAADPFVFILQFLPGQQLLTDIVDQRKRPQARFRFGPVGTYDLTLAVELGIGYDVPDGDGVALKIDGIPFQAKDLTSPETVKGGDLDQQRIRMILRCLEELLQFLQTVVIRDILELFESTWHNQSSRSHRFISGGRRIRE